MSKHHLLNGFPVEIPDDALFIGVDAETVKEGAFAMVIYKGRIITATDNGKGGPEFIVLLPGVKPPKVAFTFSCFEYALAAAAGNPVPEKKAA